MDLEVWVAFGQQTLVMSNVGLKGIAFALAHDLRKLHRLDPREAGAHAQVLKEFVEVAARDRGAGAKQGLKTAEQVVLMQRALLNVCKRELSEPIELSVSAGPQACGGAVPAPHTGSRAGRQQQCGVHQGAAAAPACGVNRQCLCHAAALRPTDRWLKCQARNVDPWLVIDRDTEAIKLGSASHLLDL